MPTPEDPALAPPTTLPLLLRVTRVGRLVACSDVHADVFLVSICRLEAAGLVLGSFCCTCFAMRFEARVAAGGGGLAEVVHTLFLSFSFVGFSLARVREVFEGPVPVVAFFTPPVFPCMLTLVVVEVDFEIDTVVSLLEFTVELTLTLLSAVAFNAGLATRASGFPPAQ